MEDLAHEKYSNLVIYPNVYKYNITKEIEAYFPLS